MRMRIYLRKNFKDEALDQVLKQTDIGTVITLEKPQFEIGLSHSGYREGVNAVLVSDKHRNEILAGMRLIPGWHL